MELTVPNKLPALTQQAPIDVYSKCLSVYMMDESMERLFFSAMGIWAGTSISIAGVFGFLNLSSWTSEGRKRCIAFSHSAFCLLAAINTLFVFVVRCVNIPVAACDGRITEVPILQNERSSACDLVALVYASIVLSVVSFMILGASFGVSIAILKSLKAPKDYYDVDLRPEPAPARIAETEEQDKRIHILTDIEATVDGLYRRLEECESD